MTREEKERAITTLRWLHDNAFLYFLYSTEEGIKFATEEGIKALEQEPCKYEDITTAFQFGMALGFAKKYDEIDKVIEEVKKVVTPQQKTGKWTDGDRICPCCGEDKFKDLDADVWSDWQPKFCPNCGAKMQNAEGWK